MLTLTMIARNAEETVARAILSAAPFVDRIVVVLAGESTDRTEQEVQRALGEARIDHPVVETFYAYEHPDAFFPDGELADFAAARNLALSLVEPGSHWLYLDADDELLDGEALAGIVERLDAGEIGIASLPYLYFFDDNDRPISELNAARIFTGNAAWMWQDRVHEFCSSESQTPILRAESPRVKHHRKTKASPRNLRLLELMLQERPGYPRAVLHYADALFGMERYMEACNQYSAYYNDPAGEPEQFYAACMATKCAVKLGELALAAQWALVAMDMRPLFKDGYLLRAEVAQMSGDNENALFWLDQASDKLENTHNTAVAVYAHDYTWNAWHVQYAALAGLRRWPEACQVAALAVHNYPNSLEWKRQLHLAEEARRIDASVMAVGQLVDHFVRRGDTLHAWDMLKRDRLPVTIREDHRIRALRAEVWKTVKHVFDPQEYRAFYDDETEHRCVGTAVDSYRIRPIVESLRKRGAKRLLDVASGSGGPAMWIAEQMPELEVVGLDINSHLVRNANAEAAERGLAERVRFLDVDLYDFISTHPGEHFDAVTLIELIEHMTPQDAYKLVGQAESIADAVMMTTPAMFCSDIPPLGHPFPRDHVYEWDFPELDHLVQHKLSRRPVELRKVWAPDVDEDRGVVYMFPGFASWFIEFDREPRNQGPVVFYLGAGPAWKPTDIEEAGLGGSETMAVRMAEQFAANNHPVVVYGEWTGVHNAVIYKHHSEFNPERPYLGVDAWLVIVSRYPSVFDRKVNADVRWLWCHDIDYGDEVTPERIANVDRVLVLSGWHFEHWRDKYPWFPLDKLVETRNAIDPRILELDAAKITHKFIWPSSADRGLHRVLEWWPAIREMWPDATLDVYYGFDYLEQAAQAPGRGWLLKYRDRVLDLAAQPGVTLKGRVSQPELWRAMASADFWLYPAITPADTVWNETYCIVAEECLALGVKPVVARAGALPERMEGAGTVVDWSAPRKKWLRELKEADRKPVVMVRRDLSYASLYRDWMRLAMMGSLIDNANGRHNFDVAGVTV